MAMGQPALRDVARQFANVFGAIFQVYASSIVGDAVGVIAQEYRSPILPASFAFAIWGPIFILCGFYAILQALPAERENPVFRSIGWWTAGAFLANGVWTYAFTNRQFVLAEGIIVAGLFLAGGAYLRFARTAPKGSATDLLNWLVAPALGLLFGWLTAAAVVGMANTLHVLGVTGQSLERVAGALLLFGGLVASVVVLVTRTGPNGAWVSYCAAALWALVAIVVEQRSASALTTGVAIVSAMLVLVAVFGPWQTVSYPRGRLARQSSPPDTQ